MSQTALLEGRLTRAGARPVHEGPAQEPAPGLCTRAPHKAGMQGPGRTAQAWPENQKIQLKKNQYGPGRVGSVRYIDGSLRACRRPQSEGERETETERERERHRDRERERQRKALISVWLAVDWAALWHARAPRFFFLFFPVFWWDIVDRRRGR